MKPTGATYGMKSYLGIPMLVAIPASLLSGKLMALMGRKRFAPRDVYDTYYFLSRQWDIDYGVFRAHGVNASREYLERCADFVASVPDSALLGGLGELIDAKQKVFVRQKLRTETVFLLKSYAAIARDGAEN